MYAKQSGLDRIDVLLAKINTRLIALMLGRRRGKDLILNKEDFNEN
jgi:hypothetical protein